MRLIIKYFIIIVNEHEGVFMNTELKDYLKKKNLKATKNRITILKYINKRRDPFSAEDINKDLMDQNPINLSTIYRTLNIFLDNDILQKVAEIDGVLYYQKLQENHQHQLICTECKAVVPIENCPIAEWKDSLEKMTGYQIASHHLELRGLCPNCQRKK